MRDDFDKINFECRPGRLIFKIFAICILGFTLAMAIVSWFGQYTRIEVWKQSVLKTSVIFFIISFIIIFFVFIKKKTNNYTIFCYDRIVIKNGKMLHFKNFSYNQTILQRCFGVIDVKFWSGNKKIIFRDVQKNIIYYLE